MFSEVVVLNKEERYSRVPRLSDTRFSAKRTKRKWRYTSSKARLKCATYPWSQYMVMWQIVKVVKVGVANFFLGQSISIDKNNSFQLTFLL